MNISPNTYTVKVYDSNDVEIGSQDFKAYTDQQAELTAPHIAAGYRSAYWTLTLKEEAKPVKTAAQVWDDMSPEGRLDTERDLSRDLGVPFVLGCMNMYSDGFSFVVPDELSAYKAAYQYQHVPRVNVTEAPNVGGWLVQVFTKE